MRSLVKLSTLFVAILLSQALSMAPSFAQSAKARVGTAAMAIILGNLGSTVTAAPDSATANCTASSNCILVNVPQVVPWGAQTDANGRMQIMFLRMLLDLSYANNPVTLTFISPDNFDNSSDQSWQVTLSPVSSQDPSCPTFTVACHDFPVPSNLKKDCPTCKDNISIVPLPKAMQFEVTFALLSDYNPIGKKNNDGTVDQTSLCASTQSQDPKIYTIATDSPVTSVCMQSFSKSALLFCTATNLAPLSLDNGDKVAGIDTGGSVACRQ